ncbi:MAG: GAF domain-containing protein [Caldilineae bacterium]|nr:MAG: GAF domain-containing protein [Caldilineae bacterium]
MNRLKQLIFSSIRNKLTAVAVIATTLAIVLGGVYTVRSLGNTLEERAAQTELHNLDAVAEDINEFLSSKEDEVLFLSRSEPLRQYLAVAVNNLSSQRVQEKRASLEQEFLAFAQTHPVYSQIRFLDAQGQEAVRINTDYFNRSTITPPDALENHADRSYFLQALTLATGELYMSPIELNIEGGEIVQLPDGTPDTVIYISTPVMFNGQVAGVMVANLRANNLLALMAEELPGTSYLTDSEGYFIYHPDEARRWSRQLETGARLASQYNTQIAGQLLSPVEGTFIERGTFFAHQPVPLSTRADTTWYLVTAHPIGEVFAPALRFIYISIGVTVVLVLVAGLGAALLGRAIAAPLAALAEAARHLAAGDFGVALPVHTQDEVGQLARAFNAMAEQIRQLVESLEKRVQERTRALETSADISRRLTTILDINELLQYVVSSLQQVFGYYHVHIYLVDETTGELVMREGSGKIGRQLKAAGHKLQPGQGIVGGVASKGRAFLAEDVDTVPQFFRNPLLPKTQSELAVPLRKGEKVLGVLDIQSDEKGGLSRNDLVLTQSIADQLAVAVDNARLFEETQTAMKQVEILNRRLTHEAWGEIRRKTRASEYVFAPGGVAPAPDDWLPAMRQAIRQKKLVQYSQKGNGQMPATDIALPLILRGEVIGVIGIERPADHPWLEDELNAVQTLGEQIALALDTARLARETEKAAWRDRVVSETTARVWSSAEVEAVMRTAVAQLGEKLGASEVVIQLGVTEEE